LTQRISTGQGEEKKSEEGKDIKKEEHGFERQVDKEVTTNSPKARQTATHAIFNGSGTNFFPSTCFGIFGGVRV